MTAAAVIALSQVASSSGAGIDRAFVPDHATGVASSQGHVKPLTAPVQTAGSSVLPTALNPAAQAHGFASPRVETLGRRTATRTAEVAVGSGGEADYTGGHDGTAEGFTSRGDTQGSAFVSTLQRSLGSWAEKRQTAVRGESSSQRCRSAYKALAFYIAATNRWRAKMGDAQGGRGHTRLAHDTSACPRYLAALWQRKARAARVAFERWFERTYEKYRCIHEHEAAWNNNDSSGNGYWGGLQFDWGFQHTYGPEFIRRYGLAHLWPVWAQLIAAERAFHGFAGFAGRGYSPWGTRGACGL